MAAAEAECGGISAKIHPSAWLVAPTLALLLGQAVAVLPWTIPDKAAFFVTLPLLLIISRYWRAWAILVVLSMLAGSVGYLRHRQLLAPVFPENHVRTVMTRDVPL